MSQILEGRPAMIENKGAMMLSDRIDRLVIELFGDSLPIGEMVDVGNNIYQQLRGAADVQKTKN